MSRKPGDYERGMITAAAIVALSADQPALAREILVAGGITESLAVRLRVSEYDLRGVRAAMLPRTI